MKKFADFLKEKELQETNRPAGSTYNRPELRYRGQGVALPGDEQYWRDKQGNEVNPKDMEIAGDGGVKMKNTTVAARPRGDAPPPAPMGKAPVAGVEPGIDRIKADIGHYKPGMVLRAVLPKADPEILMDLLDKYGA